jgi:anti-sigma factor RsiW
MGITDQLLMAYVDGELSPDLAALILSRLESEPDLLERLEEHQRLRSELSAAYGSVMGEPLPPSLTALLSREGGQPTPPPATPLFNLAKPEPGSVFRRFGGGWPVLAAAAAAVFGIGLSEARHAGDPLTRSGDGGIVASGPLARTLENSLAADAAGQVAKNSGARILASFEDRSGRYCRVFEGAAGGHEDGVACKSGGRWLVVAMANGARAEPSEDYRQASSSLAPAIASAVDELQASSALTAEQERKARAQQWRAVVASKS